LDGHTIRDSLDCVLVLDVQRNLLQKRKEKGLQIFDEFSRRCSLDSPDNNMVFYMNTMVLH